MSDPISTCSAKTLADLESQACLYLAEQCEIMDTVYQNEIQDQEAYCKSTYSKKKQKKDLQKCLAEASQIKGAYFFQSADGKIYHESKSYDACLSEALRLADRIYSPKDILPKSDSTAESIGSTESDKTSSSGSSGASSTISIDAAFTNLEQILQGEQSTIKIPLSTDGERTKWKEYPFWYELNGNVMAYKIGDYNRQELPLKKERPRLMFQFGYDSSNNLTGITIVEE